MVKVWDTTLWLRGEGGDVTCWKEKRIKAESETATATATKQ